MLRTTSIESARILIVDDEAANIRLLERILAGAGFEQLVSTRDSTEAFTLYRQHRPDLILLDLHMPRIDGFGVLEQLRPEIAWQAFLPILVLSADITPAARQQALSSGAKDFLAKPFDPAEVLLRIRNLLETRALHLQGQEQNRLLEEQLRHSQRMEVIGRLTSGIAHDFNNMLTVIHGNASMALMTVTATDPLHEEVTAIQAAAERAAALTRQVLNFGRGRRSESQVLDLNAEISTLQGSLLRLVGGNVDVVTRLDASLGPVRADPSQIEQVLMNLVVNARDAMPDGGRIEIETRSVGLTRDQLERQPYLTPGRYAQLTVRDTGHGMDAATRQRVFAPFFTTKAEGKGTGLGLSIVYSTVKQSRGYVWIESEPGHGTAVIVLLPLTTEVTPPAVTVPARAEPPAGSGTVLVVEDEEQVGSLLRRVLLVAGYRALPARTGHEALHVCAQYEGPIGVVVIDVVLPDLAGRALVERLASLRPGIRMLMISGYPEHESLAQELGLTFLKKPFTTEVFVNRVRELTDEG